MKAILVSTDNLNYEADHSFTISVNNADNTDGYFQTILFTTEEE